MIRILFILFLLGIPIYLSAQLKSVPYDHVITNDELIQLLNDSDQELKSIKKDYTGGKKEKALNDLTLYFKEVFAERYFFSWKNFDEKLKDYNSSYSKRHEYHKKNAYKHLELYPANVQWKIPFINKKNKTVTSYPYRHLTRQQYAGDIALLYHYTNNKNYLNYIPKQAKSLNEAFNKGLVETIDDGNGAYEAFRAGKRIAYWLFAHQVLLSKDVYSYENQLIMIKNFLHTGAKLYHHNKTYHEGNHQTKGMSSLMMLSILFEDVKGCDLWFERSKSILESHLEKEIYSDGFQFERTVHYHISDIRNYLYPYLLAKNNKKYLGQKWDNKIEALFNSFIKLSMPDKNAPVLQDDTDSPWAEYNRIDDITALGAAVFNRKDFKYFASKKLSSKDFWYLSNEQILSFKSLKTKKPGAFSTEFPVTGYYIMRNGWKENNCFMIISCGLTDEKLDHQHGDMLGLQAYAFGNMILPNYQVRYYLNDLQFFKNSWVKNVALADSVLQGQNWKGNKGGSGFGKFKNFPEPQTISWIKEKDIDVFTGTHNAYEEKDVTYNRQVIFIKDGFWIVRDLFHSEKESFSYQQIWQGHYDQEDSLKHYRSTFSNGAGLDIIQLGDQAKSIKKSSFRGKGNLVFSSDKAKDFNYISLLYPFKDFDDRINEIKKEETFKLRGWTAENSNIKKIKDTDADIKLSKKESSVLINTSKFSISNISFETLNGKADIYIKKNDSNPEITNIGFKEIELKVNNKKSIIKPGEKKVYNN